MKAAIYARYSSDLQSESSIDDQIRLCSAFILGRNWQLTEVYADKATSGASHLRLNYQQMLQDIRAGKINYIVAEALDRLSRDQEDVARLFKQTAFLGIKIITVTEGEITELHIGLKGTMNALYLKDLAQKTKRGLEGRIREGHFAGGNAYGYRTVKEFDSTGDIITGRREVVPEEVAIVHNIFEEFAAGKSPRQIAKELNAENIPGPNGRKWQDTTIRGHAKRGIGVINNELYVGKLVWNKQRFIKDPATGKRVSRTNPTKEWIIHEMPELRIISDNLWKSVKARQEIIAYKSKERCANNSLTGARRNKYLLSGLLICGKCKGGFTLLGKDKYGCANRKNNGTCDNKAMVRRRDIEHRVLAGLKHKLLEPNLVSKFIDEYTTELEKLTVSNKQEQNFIKRELQKIEKRLNAVLNAIEQGIVTDSTKNRLIELEDKKKELGSKLSEEAYIPRPDKKLIGLYQTKVKELGKEINDPEFRTAAMDTLRQLIEHIVLYPQDGPGCIRAELYGELGNLVSLEDASLFSGAQNKISVVAGAGFEPTTFRL